MIDAFDLARAEVMLAGYSARWYDEPYEVLAVEAEFAGPLRNPETGAESKTFQLGGKLDVLVRDLRENRALVVEHKSSGEDISPGSFYWRRLTLNAQISTYMVGARELGVEPAGVLYDVLGKPAIRPASVPLVDDEGVKIVCNAAGERVRTKDGKKWRETGDSAQGYVLQTRPEKVDEFRRRLTDVIAEAPEAYFARGMVVRLDAEEREAAFDAWQTAAWIREGRRADRYPRNPDGCSMYGSICVYFPVCSGQADLEDPTRYQRHEQRHSELATDVARLPLVSNSELATFRRCQRLHHYRYDLGIRALEDTADAARLGTLIHRGLEGWWLGKKYEEREEDCLARALHWMRTPPPEKRPQAPAPAGRTIVL